MEKMSIEGREGGIWSKSVPESTRPRKIINKNEKGIVNRGKTRDTFYAVKNLFFN